MQSVIQAQNISSSPLISPKEKLCTGKFYFSLAKSPYEIVRGDTYWRYQPDGLYQCLEDQVTCLPLFWECSGTSGPPSTRCCTKWGICSVPPKAAHLIRDSSALLSHISDCCPSRCWFLFQRLFLILSHLTAKGNAHFQLHSLPVFQISPSPQLCF